MYKKNPIKNIDYVHDYYHYLGIQQDANNTEIKRAYQKKSQEYHPDKVESLGDSIKEVSKRLYPLILEGYKLLMDNEKRVVYDEVLNSFKKDKPSLISTDGYAMLDLTIELFDLDFILSSEDEYDGQAKFRQKYEQMCGFNEATFNVIKNAYILNPNDEQLKKAYFEQMTHKNVFLNMKEMESYMGIGIINKKDVPAIGVHGYLDTVESELNQINHNFQKNIELRLLTADTEPLLLDYEGKDIINNSKELKEFVTNKYNESFEKRKQKVIEVAKEKQDFLNDYVKLRNFDKLKSVENKNIEVIVVLKDKILCSIKVDYENNEYQPAQYNGEFSEKTLDSILLDNSNNNVYWLEWNPEISFNIFVMEFINDICNGEIQ